MSVKRIAFLALFSATTFTTHAASPEISFNVETTIPDNSFYVVGTGWENTTQNMIWSEGRLALSNINQNLKMKNTSGGISAYLADSPVLVSSNNTDNIPLSVMIGGKTLGVGTVNGVDILTATEAETEQLVGMEVSQASTFTQITRPSAGNYLGTVTMVFDSVPITAP